MKTEKKKLHSFDWFKENCSKIDAGCYSYAGDDNIGKYTNHRMIPFFGKEVTIVSYDKDYKTYKIKEDGRYYNWYEWMFDENYNPDSVDDIEKKYYFYSYYEETLCMGSMSKDFKSEATDFAHPIEIVLEANKRKYGNKGGGGLTLLSWQEITMEEFELWIKSL